MSDLNEAIAHLRRVTDGMVADVNKAIGVSKSAVTELNRSVGAVEEAAGVTPGGEEGEKPVSRMTKTELLVEAQRRGLGASEDLTVAELRELFKDE